MILKTNRSPGTTVVIATSLDAVRAKLIHNAVNSVLEQQSIPATLILVINGSRYDPDALRYWQKRRDIQVIYQEEGNVVKARLIGRQQVDTEFFGFLDDDDIYLPHTLQRRVIPMQENEKIDVVIGNGLICRGGKSFTALNKLDLHRTAPLEGLAFENWMPSACAGTFRTEKIGIEYFEHPEYYMEWTALAFRLAAHRKEIHFIDDLTFKIEDTPGSLSKSLEYQVGAVETLSRMLKLDIPYKARKLWDAKYGGLLHDLSSFHLARGEWALAWKYHIASLRRAGRERYLLYTRKLLLPF